MKYVTNRLCNLAQVYHDFEWLLVLPEIVVNRYHKTMTTFEDQWYPTCGLRTGVQ